MKTIYICFSILLSTSFLIHAQEVEVTLSGNTTAQGFSVLDNSSNTLFRVRGDGSVGVGTATPAGIFDIIGGIISSGDARGINILAQSTDDLSGNCGDINIKSGYSELNGGSINIETQGSSNDPGDINIKTNDREADMTGNINIITDATSGTSGNIKIQTGFTDGRSGDIELIGGNSISGEQGGNILLSAGANYSSSGTAGLVSIQSGNGIDLNGGNLDLTAGNSMMENGGDVNITSGNSTVDGDGGNIILNPGTGATGFGVDGMVILNGSGTYSGTWTQSSDERFKKNIEPLRNSIDKIEQLDGVSYELRKEEFPEKNFSNRKQIGLIAQDVEKVLPELVRTDSKGYKSVAYQNMVPVLIEAIKEQQDEIEDLNDRIIKLERMIYSDVKLVKNEE